MTRGIVSRALTFVLAGGQGQRLHPLTRHRAKPAVPIGGVYRLIDFTLSNCFNSGLRRIHVLTQYQCDSLHSYVQALAPKIPIQGDRDEFLLCLCPPRGKSYRGTADAVFQNLQLIEKTRPEFVVILSGDHVYRMDYRNLLRFHSECDAEVTIAGVECPRNAASQFGVLETDSAGRAVNFEEKPNKPKAIFAKPSRSLVSMGVYVFKTRTLMDALSDDAQRNTSHDFGKNIIPSLIRSNRVCVYNFTELGTRLGSYWRDVGTVDAYYHANMELPLSPFFDSYAGARWALYSSDGHLQPAGRHTGRRARAFAMDSVIAQGVSLARGSRAIHSVLSPGVQIDRLSEVQNSILLHGVSVGARARIRRAIIEENVHIGEGVEIGYDVNRDREYGLVTDSGIVVVPANTHVGASQKFTPAFSTWRTEGIKVDRVESLKREVICPMTAR